MSGGLNDNAKITKEFLLKLSGEALAGEQKTGIDTEMLGKNFRQNM